jgi:hypothetical protein
VKRIFTVGLVIVALGCLTGATVLVLDASDRYDDAKRTRSGAATARSTRNELQHRYETALQRSRRARRARDAVSGPLSTLVSSGSTFMERSNAVVSSHNDLINALNASIDASPSGGADVENADALLQALDESVRELERESTSLQDAYAAVAARAQ